MAGESAEEPVSRIECRDWGFACLWLAIYLAIAASLPLGSALQLGGDEGFELTKAFLCYRGHTLYDEIWNDQPPAHTLLLAGLFHFTGPSLLAARLLAVGFGALLVWVLADLLRRQTGPWAAALGVGVFLAAPMALNLSVSVMLEVPAFAVGLLAAWLLEQRSRLFQPGKLLASAVALAVALQIKLTAGLLIPALLVLLQLRPMNTAGTDRGGARSEQEGSPPSSSGGQDGWFNQCRLRLAERTRVLTVWLGALVGAYALLSWCLGSGGYDLLWASHHSPAMRAELDRMREYRFTLSELGQFPEGVTAALVGVALLIWLRDWRRMMFPAVWLVTALVIHANHRPWWGYYMLHFDVPMAWFCALAIHAAHRLRRNSQSANGRDSLWRGRAAQGIPIVLISLAAVYGTERFAREFMSLRSSPRVEDCALVRALRHYAPHVRWMFTRDTIYAFHAQVSLPPPLAVLPAKRFWSGRLSEAELLSRVQAWQPELLLVGEDEFKAGWERWLASPYALVTQAQDLALWVRKDIAGDRQAPAKPRVDNGIEARLGL